MYKCQKGDYESMKADALKFAKEKYFNGYSGTRSVQEKKVQVGKDQEKAQSEKDSHSKNQDGKKPN